MTETGPKISSYVDMVREAPPTTRKGEMANLVDARIVLDISEDGRLVHALGTFDERAAGQDSSFGLAGLEVRSDSLGLNRVGDGSCASLTVSVMLVMRSRQVGRTGNVLLL